MVITGSILFSSKWYVKWNINLVSLVQFNLKSYYFFIYLISAYYWEAPHLWLHVDFCSSIFDATTLWFYSSTLCLRNLPESFIHLIYLRFIILWFFIYWDIHWLILHHYLARPYISFTSFCCITYNIHFTWFLTSCFDLHFSFNETYQGTLILTSAIYKLHSLWFIDHS